MVILFVSSLVRSILGFGDALIAMPLLSLFLPVKFSTPIVAVISTILSLSIIIKDRKNVHFNQLKILIISTIIGIPIGIYLLDKLDESLIKLVLGLVLISFSLFNLIKPNLFTITTNKFDWIFGFISGVLGGAYNTNGPPIILYASLRKWDMAVFRTSLQTIFFPTNIVILSGHIISGNFTGKSIEILTYMIPVLAVSMYVGHHISKKINKEKFIVIVYYILIILGILLCI